MCLPAKVKHFKQAPGNRGSHLWLNKSHRVEMIEVTPTCRRVQTQTLQTRYMKLVRSLMYQVQYADENIWQIVLTS